MTDPFIIYAVLIYVFLFSVVYFYQKQQIKHAHMQAHYFAEFRKAVTSLREEEGLHPDLREFMELLVTIPSSGLFVRALFDNYLKRGERKSSTESRRKADAFISLLDDLPDPLHERYDTMIISFLQATFHSHLIAGFPFRRMMTMLAGRRAQADFAVGTFHGYDVRKSEVASACC